MVSLNHFDNRLVRIFGLVALGACLVGCPKNNNPAAVEKKKTVAVDIDNMPREGALADKMQEVGVVGPVAISASNQPDESRIVAEEVVSPVEGSTSPGTPEPAVWRPQGSWTTRRMIVLSPGGPLALDVSISVGRSSLDEASEEMIAGLSNELLGETKDAIAWSALLEQPLIKSGWLGNLVADEEQQEQLIGMYDLSKDGLVDADELPAFLSRGLSRSEAVQLTDAGNAPDVDMAASPWGVMDRNDDYSMDSDELAALSSEIMKFDLNGDAVVSSQELADSSGSQMATSPMSRSMLDVNTVVFVDADGIETQTRKLASNILRHYTFLESIARDQWSGWSDELWSAVDSDGDQQINTKELQNLFTGEVDYRIFITLPSVAAPNRQFEFHCLLPAGSTASWEVNSGGGHLLLPGCSALIQVSDSFSAPGESLLRNQLEAALGNAQLRAFFTNQLQLSEGGFELADSDGNLKLDDQEFRRLWSWLAVRQGARLVGRWMVSGKPWFQLADSNGDARLTEFELTGFVSRVKLLDQNGDGRITPHEMPLVTRFELARTDNRLAAGPFGGPTTDAVQPDADWFAAMDANRDGVISRAEFLGSRQDFFSVDLDKDGFVSRSEVAIVP